MVWENAGSAMPKPGNKARSQTDKFCNGLVITVFRNGQELGFSSPLALVDILL